ncbi:redoxin domain-containing protein [Pedobacter sp. HMF7056]|uniref:Redoxin domain-containing protein n=2 Tax=Hufsiella ginkgonis TaxID=2695274 RepID=A0A7K1XVU4_9SPHI|nr:TlpA disulfide reductase family protein [Hufsiella ginkgonis]MXV15113.1 redoxin domain-containing protein [Hufsiella ginkgonis]
MAVLVIASCKNKNQFTINGKIENGTGLNKVMLMKADQVIDSAILNEKQEFRFTRNEPEPDFYVISIGEKNFQVIAQNGDVIDFKTNMTDTTGNYSIEGSEASAQIREFNQLSVKYGKVYTRLQKEFERVVTANPAAKDSVYNALMPEFQANMDAFAKEALAFGDKNKNNLAGFYAVGSLNAEVYEQEMIRYAEEIKPLFPGNKAVQSFVEKMLEVKSVSVGQHAPAFEIPGVNGKPVKLSDFKGKYVLVDFWASWCVPCRQENPNVVKTYNLYKDKGFTVFGVSLDEDKAAWQKAISDDQLTWTHASDLKGWKSAPAALYKVSGIPASFVLNPEGVIVAKNLRGEQLEEFLKKTLK